MKVIFLITLVEILFVLSDCSKGRGRNLDISEEDQSMIVMYHNEVRRNVSGGDAVVKELKWDPDIAEFAKDWGKQCIYKRPFDDPFVENLFYKRYRKRDKPKEVMMDAIGAWLKRKDVHGPGRKGCRRSETCKYVELSTADTESVGCTVTECPVLHFRNSRRKSMYYVVCFYKPSNAAAVETKAPPRVKTCSECPSGYTCRRNRCVRLTRPFPEGIPGVSNPFSKHRRHPQTRRLEAPSADIVVRNDIEPVHRKGGHETRFEVQGLPEKNFRYDRYPAPENPIIGRRAKRQATRYDTYEERRRRQYYEQLRREQDARRRRITDPRIRVDTRRRTDRIYLEQQRRRQEVENERRRLEQQRRERERERQRRQRRPRPPAQQIGGGSMTSREISAVTDAHNNLRRIQRMAALTWDPKLQRWANYVIRCDIEYPGPITDYTNFGKADSRRDLTSVVNNWGSEGNDVFQRLSNGCRTPYDRSQCNHYTIMMSPSIDRIGCSSLNCGSRRQLTCIYRDNEARPFRRRG